MDEEEIRDLVERLLDELARIRSELDGIETAPVDLTPVILIAVLAAVLALAALAAAAVALFASRRVQEASHRLERERAGDERRTERAALASELRRYSQVLGVEAVTGRPAGGGESTATLRERLESRAAASTEPGALELLDEVRDSRARLDDLPPDTRAAASGLAGMTVEWSIERWRADPDAWLRDHRERARLQALGRRAGLAPASTEPDEADTRRR